MARQREDFRDDLVGGNDELKCLRASLNYMEMVWEIMRHSPDHYDFSFCSVDVIMMRMGFPDTSAILEVTERREMECNALILLRIYRHTVEAKSHTVSIMV